MKLIVCTIKDRAIDAYGRPFFTPHSGGAIRSFIDEINRANPDNPMHGHSDDFDLYELGEYDDNTGFFNTHDSPKLLMLGKSAKVPENT